MTVDTPASDRELVRTPLIDAPAVIVVDDGWLPAVAAVKH